MTIIRGLSFCASLYYSFIYKAARISDKRFCRTMKFCASSGVTFVLASAPKNPQPTQKTTTRDNNVPAFLQVHRKTSLPKFLMSKINFQQHCGKKYTSCIDCRQPATNPQRSLLQMIPWHLNLAAIALP